MGSRTAITVNRSRDEVQRLWADGEHPDDGAAVTFKDAPGDRGTEIHVELSRGGLLASRSLAKVKDDLRRFKQLVETGVISRSEAVPEGELAGRKLKQRPAQPLEEVSAP
jgi:uncharacterized membrane protein